MYLQRKQNNHYYILIQRQQKYIQLHLDHIKYMQQYQRKILKQRNQQHKQQQYQHKRYKYYLQLQNQFNMKKQEHCKFQILLNIIYKMFQILHIRHYKLMQQLQKYKQLHQKDIKYMILILKNSLYQHHNKQQQQQKYIKQLQFHKQHKHLMKRNNLNYKMLHFQEQLKYMLLHLQQYMQYTHLKLKQILNYIQQQQQLKNIFLLLYHKRHKFHLLQNSYQHIQLHKFLNMQLNQLDKLYKLHFMMRILINRLQLLRQMNKQQLQLDILNMNQLQNPINIHSYKLKVRNKLHMQLHLIHMFYNYFHLYRIH